MKKRQPSYTPLPFTKSGMQLPYKFKSDYHRRAWWFLNNSKTQPDPDPELTWWVWAGRLILSFIDWLNRLVGAEKPKEKTNGEQMDSISDLFEEVEPGVDWGADEDKPKSAGSYKSAGGYIYRWWDDNDRSEDYEDVGRERGTDHVMGG